MADEGTILDILGIEDEEFREGVLQSYNWIVAGFSGIFASELIGYIDNIFLALVVALPAAGIFLIVTSMVDVYYKRYLDWLVEISD